MKAGNAAALYGGFCGVSLFSGMALVAHIVSGISLRLILGVAVVLIVAAIGAMWRRCGATERAWIVRCAAVGTGSGFLATASYDLSKFAFSQLDSSPYNPFEAIRVFGCLLAGASAPRSAIYAAGAGFHLLNGTCFGIAFCLLFGSRGVLAGIAWGAFLEMFQLTLYPGWLDIRAYREFAQISAASHVVYGSVLGWCCRQWLGRHAIDLSDSGRTR